MDRQLIPYYLAFNSLYKLRSCDVVGILDHFGGDAESAWRQPQKWRELLPVSASTFRSVLELQQQKDPQALYREFMAAGCGLTCFFDEDYPPALDSIFDPPLLLFYRGTLPKVDDLALAMVGSRRATEYGLQVADILCRDLASQGAWIISGMARGIDSVCHRAALRSGGKTLAVLGCGLDVIYPPENDQLYAQICDNGAVISEFPLGLAALAKNFPRRNRIISGLSRGIVVVEAGENSGTMHTVNHGLEQGKDVFAVPGPITSPFSKGTNRLLREMPGVAMVTCAQDIWDFYSDLPMKPAFEAAAQPQSKGDDREEALLHLLLTPQQIDQIPAKSGLQFSPGELASTLTMLEIRGLVKQLPGKYYQTVVKKL